MGLISEYQIGKLNKYAQVLASDITKIFSALEALRQRHKNYINPNSAFNTDIANQNNTIFYNTNNEHKSYPVEIKKDIQILETSKYIPDSYSSQVNIPQLADYITAADYYNGIVDLIDSMDQQCVHDANFANFANFGNFGNFSNNGNKSNHSIDFACGTVYSIGGDSNFCSIGQGY